MTINEIFPKFPNKRTIEHIEDNFAFNHEDAIRLLEILLKENKYIVLGVDVLDEHLVFTYDQWLLSERKQTNLKEDSCREAKDFIMAYASDRPASFYFFTIIKADVVLAWL